MNPREVNKDINKAKELIIGGDYNKAIRILDKILLDQTNALYVLAYFTKVYAIYKDKGYSEAFDMCFAYSGNDAPWGKMITMTNIEAIDTGKAVLGDILGGAL